MAMAGGSFASRVVATRVVATDGTGDFTDIQSAIDDLPSGGGVVYVKEGTYAITSAITITSSNVGLIGAGKSTKISTSSNINMLEIGTTSGGTISGVMVENIYFYGSQGAANRAIEFVTSGGGASTVQDVTVHKCWIEHVATGIITAANMTMNRIILRGNWVSDASGYGLNPNGYNDSVISDNIIGSCGVYGMNCVTVNDTMISGNIVFNNVRHGMFCDGVNDSVIVGNVCKDNDSGDTGTYSGIFLNANCDNNTITGNSCTGNDDYGIEIANANCDNNAVVANNLRNNTTGGLGDSGTGTSTNNNVT